MPSSSSAKGNKPRRRKWWHSISESDPISLEPLRRCKIEPFTLTESSHKYHFDAQVLAAYLVATQNFTNPLTRNPLDLKDCVALDAHLARNKIEADVARAWELSKREWSSERDRLREQARDLMQSLFQGNNATRHNQGESIRAQLAREEEEQQQEGQAMRSPPRSVAEEDDGSSYPALQPTSRLVEPASVWARQRRALVGPSTREVPRSTQEKRTSEPTERARRLAEAFGASTPVRSVEEEVRWPAELIQWARNLPSLEALRRVERKLADVVESGRPADVPRSRQELKRFKELAEFYSLAVDEFEADVRGEQHYLRVRVDSRGMHRIPHPLLSEAAANGSRLPPSYNTRTAPQRRPVVNIQRRQRQQPRRRLSVDSQVPEEKSNHVANVFWELLDEEKDEAELDKTGGTPVSNFLGTADGDECSICLFALKRADRSWAEEEEEEDVVALKCGHRFHGDCFAKWSDSTHDRPGESDYDTMTKTISCPHCRQAHVLSSIQLPRGRYIG